VRADLQVHNEPGRPGANHLIRKIPPVTADVPNLGRLGHGRSL